MPNNKDCPKKHAIDNEAELAKADIEKVLTDTTANLSSNLKDALGAAITHLNKIMADHHHL